MEEIDDRFGVAVAAYETWLQRDVQRLLSAPPGPVHALGVGAKDMRALEYLWEGVVGAPGAARPGAEPARPAPKQISQRPGDRARLGDAGGVGLLSWFSGSSHPRR